MADMELESRLFQIKLTSLWWKKRQMDKCKLNNEPNSPPKKETQRDGERYEWQWKYKYQKNYAWKWNFMHFSFVSTKAITLVAWKSFIPVDVVCVNGWKGNGTPYVSAKWG